MATVTQPRTQTIEKNDDEQLLDRVVETTQRKLLTQRAAEQLGCNPKNVMNVLREHVFRVKQGETPFSDSELFAALTIIAKYHLDPILKEIHVTRDKQGRVLTIVGYDGWMKILNKTDGYDGFEQLWRESDDGKTVEWCETVIYHKERSHPTAYRAYMHEWVGNTGYSNAPWLKYPRHMLSVRSICHCSRRFASLGALYTEEEAAFILSQPSQEHDDISETIEPEVPSTKAALDRMKKKRDENLAKQAAEKQQVELQEEHGGEQEHVETVNDADKITFYSLKKEVAQAREEGHLSALDDISSKAKFACDSKMITGRERDAVQSHIDKAREDLLEGADQEGAEQ